MKSREEASSKEGTVQQEGKNRSNQERTHAAQLGIQREAGDEEKRNLVVLQEDLRKRLLSLRRAEKK